MLRGSTLPCFICSGRWWWYNDVDYLFWHILGTLVRTVHRLNTTVADPVHRFMTTVYSSSNGCFQDNDEPCCKVQIISAWFLEHCNEFMVLKWPPQSPDLNPTECLFGMWWNRRFLARMCSHQVCSNCVMLSSGYGSNVSNKLLNLWHEKLRQ